ncbi:MULTISPECIES: D-2-hydroxyacid dehydrogenase [unclassified Lactobacillus]|uniref:D-2-hydroxyacid dehydrogenase n=1 Tax=unclassified Lactobacillus TaxID=2620435 RepID=UPI000EFC5C58|nr:MULTISPECIES: D-2-hydroxyacid dehydrogenase [unclassified Lactobacillus]RMC23554.1 D-2-hydroxyacid dehydrogenase [Lactobacillus sp. ESL0247]RMC27353.1 D-2-hydroxyacid dehydrogenase [Lactobacillus sp. ESL0246]RMC30479.1 D-2-hydroxyacid dehydrogenase [Lactobacillus sp. ESL0245]RMC47291.1 D-2-hydroxyacid dehydrogenase [Lactobacillus sp. ESL0228]
MKIICYGVIELEKPYINKWAKENNVEIKLVKEELNDDNVGLAEGYSGVSSEGITPVNEVVYSKLESFGIKQLAIRQVGVDNQDLNAAKRHGIRITNVAAYSPRAIAEMGVTQAMYLLRKIGIYQERMEKGNFTYDQSTISTEIFNCTVGLIGAGHIGSATAQIYNMLGAKVITYDPYYDASLEPFTTYVDLDTIYKESDIISLHVPLLPNTKKIINENSINKMKKKPILLNMARGGLVDTQALIKALKNGKISAAGLDTLEDEIDFFGKQLDEESLPKDYQILHKMPNVLITPHIAFFTELAIKNSMEIALNDAKTIINGGTTRSIVNP